jgi:MoxR-like ATPase
VASADIRALEEWLSGQIIGQSHLVQRLIIALLADGHLLVEGAPGLAKTRAIKSLADGMAERQVSVGSETYDLPALFLVMATQNPIEQEGTYPLPEAQLDRFLLHVNVDYPSAEAEAEILRLTRAEASQAAASTPTPLRQDTVFAARQEALSMHMAAPVEQYIVQLVIASRDPGVYSEQLAGWIEYGGSPRATIALDRCSRAHAWLQGRDFVSPDDVQAVAADVLRHRLLLSFEAEANGVTPDQVIDELLALVPVG